MSHPTDDLELFALGALAPQRQAEVAGHLAECERCRLEAAPLIGLVDALPETLPPLDPPPALRERLLASARAGDAAPPTARRREAPRWLPLAGLAAAAALLLVLNVVAARGLAETRAERDELAEVALTLSHGGRWWYMAGRDEFAGAGGTLVMSSQPGRPALALFHDLPALEGDRRYALWLGDAAGERWVRGATFEPERDAELHAVELAVSVEGWERCAVSIERRDSGPREGPVIMESRIQTR